MSDAQEMPAKTLRALRASIEHWVENGKAETPYDASISATACELCLEFFHKDCVGCPVADATGYTKCGKTPYLQAVSAHSDWERADPEILWDWQIYYIRYRFHEASHDMENFLRALVPAGSSS